MVSSDKCYRLKTNGVCFVEHGCVCAVCILWISVNCMHKINGLNYLFKQIVVNNDVGDDLNAIDGGIRWKKTRWRKNQQRTKRRYKNAQSEVSYFFCVLRTAATTTAMAANETARDAHNTNDYFVLWLLVRWKFRGCSWRRISAPVSQCDYNCKCPVRCIDVLLAHCLLARKRMEEPLETEMEGMRERDWGGGGAHKIRLQNIQCKTSCAARASSHSSLFGH